MSNTKEILALSVEIADLMLRNGAEIYRIEDTVIHILKAFDEIKEFDVYVLSNGIFASANEHEEDSCSMIRHVPLGNVNLAKITYLNQLARDLSRGKCTIEEGWERVEKAKAIPSYANWVQILFCGLGCGSYAFLFGGGGLEFGIAFVIGLIEQALLLFLNKHKVSRFLRNVYASFLVSTLAILIGLTGIPMHMDKVIIGAIMVLVPGITFTTSIRDFHNGDYLCGTIHLIDALLTAVCIAVGICLPLMIYTSLGGGALLP